MQNNPVDNRAAEEQHLTDTIKIVQDNLEQMQKSIEQLTEDTENYMHEANRTQDTAILNLWNIARAQLAQTKQWKIRSEKARKKPYFGRIDFQDIAERKQDSFYIGRVGINKTPTEPVVIDWRAPIASVYYDNNIGIGTYTVDSEKVYDIDLQRKRTYEIENDKLVDFYDLDVVSNDELLTKYLSKNKSEVLGEIIATIQKEQNSIIRRSPKTNVIVQGVAGSGKTTVAMHRISYILFNYAEEFKPEDFYIIGSNQILLNYITGVLPELDVYGAKQMTMEQLFIRLLYEDWDPKKYTVAPSVQETEYAVKGSGKWFSELEHFCQEYEKEQIPCKDINVTKAKRRLLAGEQIAAYIDENPMSSMQSKRLMLNELLYSRYENFIAGKGVLFTEEEQKELDKLYHTYFAKWGKYGSSKWDGSIFELYQAFLQEQKEKGYQIQIPETTFDVYDLAALAYLYKRIKEIDPIREATHVVIDEAQDFGMMVYNCMHYCLRGCTYTIMGDTSQNIHFQYGLNDWEELKQLILTGVRDSFCLLRKSYRNTIEISDFATEILRHGDFPIYPVEPIIRHGSSVKVEQCGSTVKLTNQAIKAIQQWQEQGYETIAVICADAEEVQKVQGRLEKRLSVKVMNEENATFGSGVMVLPVSDTKGLEFDAVLLWDPSAEKYPADNGNVKMLYVASTRALHELSVLYTKNLTPLIGEKARKHQNREDVQECEEPSVTDTTQKVTVKERLERQKQDAQREMNERSYLGPQRIQAKTSGSTWEGIIHNKKPETKTEKQTEEKKPIHESGIKGEGLNTSPYKYGEMPEERELMVKGHVRPNLAVKWCRKTKNTLEITSQYGILTLTPISEECIRVQFTKGLQSQKKSSVFDEEPSENLKWTAKESSTAIEIATKKLVVRIEKRDGALRFQTAGRKLLLSEKSLGSRVIEGTETWNFFEFERSEKLRSKGLLKDDYSDITNKARYISAGGRKLRMPYIVSNKGYSIGIAAEDTVMFCGIKTYGPYIYTAGTDQIDYYFYYSQK